MDDLFIESISEVDTDSFIKEGLELYSMGKREEAIAFWRDILDFNPDYDQCQHYLDIALIEVNNLSKNKNVTQEEPKQQKVKQTETIQQAELDDTEEMSFSDMYAAAMDAYIHRHYTEAEILFKKCLIKQPDDKRIQHNLDRISNR